MNAFSVWARIGKSLGLLGLVLTSMCADAQYIFYGKANEHLGLKDMFQVLGEVGNETIIYFKNGATPVHTLGYYDKRMHLLRTKKIEGIPSFHKVIKIQRLAGNAFMVIHVAPTSSTRKQSCYYSRMRPEGTLEYTKLFQSINYDGDDDIFHVVSSPSSFFFNVFVFGQKNEDTSAIVTGLFDNKGELLKQGLHFFGMGMYSNEVFGGALLNDRGDFFFYSSSEDRFKRYQYAKVFFQTKTQQTLTFQLVELATTTQEKEVTELKTFYNPISNSWNLLAVFQQTKDRNFTAGVRLLGWQCDSVGSLMTDYVLSFQDYLAKLSARLDPSFFEDAQLNVSRVKNKSLLDRIKQLPKEEDQEQQEEDNEEENSPSSKPPMLEGDDDEIKTKFQHLLELFSLYRVEIMDVVLQSNGDFTVFFENKSSATQSRSGGGSSFLKTFSPMIVVGVGGAMSTGGFGGSGFGTGLGINIPVSGGGYGGGIDETANGLKQLNDLSVMNFSANGQFKWGTNISKKQMSNLGDNLSYFSIKKKEEMYIFYVNQGAPAYLYSLKIAPNGNVSMLPTVRGVSSAYRFVPLMSTQTGSSSTVLPCIFKERLVFSRLVYE